MIFFERLQDFHLNNKVYQDITPFADGMAGIREDDKWRFIDTDFEVAIDAEFDSVQQFIKNL